MNRMGLEHSDVHRNEKARRATIKALPTLPNRPRPYGSLDFLPLSPAEVDAYWGYFRGGGMARGQLRSFAALRMTSEE